MEGVQSSYF